MPLGIFFPLHTASYIPFFLFPSHRVSKEIVDKQSMKIPRRAQKLVWRTVKSPNCQKVLLSTEDLHSESQGSSPESHQLKWVDHTDVHLHLHLKLPRSNFYLRNPILTLEHSVLNGIYSPNSSLGGLVSYAEEEMARL